MKVVATPEVGYAVRAGGGRLFVWPDRQRCCQGATYLLTAPEPAPGREYRRVEGATGFELYLDPGHLLPPDELHLAVRGWRRRRVEAYWNGCVFVA